MLDGNSSCDSAYLYNNRRIVLKTKPERRRIGTANYIGILTWAVLIGIALRHSSENTKTFFGNMGEAVSQVVRWVIKFAPLGVMGLVFNSIYTTGITSLKQYGKIILLLVGVMVFVALVVNPIIVYIKIRRNPYPLVLKCLKDSGVTAFFTRSSAANIPVNMGLCDRLGLDRDTYSISIPLGATINMGGAAVTISVLTLIYLTDHPLRPYEEEINRWVNFSTLELKEDNLEDLDNKKVVVAGTVESRRELLTKKQEQMAFLQIEDFYAPLDVVCFPRIYAPLRSQLETGRKGIFMGRLQISESDEPKLLLESFMPLGEFAETVYLKVRSMNDSKWKDYSDRKSVV